LLDLLEHLAQVAGEWVSGSDGVAADADADRAVSAGGLDELADRPSCGVFDPVGYVC
jgi:hypothetical protein